MNTMQKQTGNIALIILVVVAIIAIITIYMMA